MPVQLNVCVGYGVTVWPTVGESMDGMGNVRVGIVLGLVANEPLLHVAASGHNGRTALVIGIRRVAVEFEAGRTVRNGIGVEIEFKDGRTADRYFPVRSRITRAERAAVRRVLRYLRQPYSHPVPFMAVSAPDRA